MLTTHGVRSRSGAELQRALLSVARQARFDLRDVCRDGADRKVHRLRLRMKKLQALLALATNVSATRRANLRARIRLIKKSVSRHRDQQAMTKLIATLRADHPRRFKCQETVVRVESLTNGKGIALRRTLSSVISELQHLKPVEITPALITAAHLSTQALVHKHFRDCQEKPSVKRMHRWRKSVKRFYFQALFLRRPLVQVVLASRLDAILGKLHDCALLRKRHHANDELQRTLKDQIKKLRAKALQKARQLSRER